jgi:hypothetical protein
VSLRLGEIGNIGFTQEAAMAMTRNLKVWASILAVWLLVALGLVAMYSADQIAVGSLVFFQALAVVLAVTAYIFMKKTGEVSDTEEIEQLLYGGPPAAGAEDGSRRRVV